MHVCKQPLAKFPLLLKQLEYTFPDSVNGNPSTPVQAMLTPIALPTESFEHDSGRTLLCAERGGNFHSYRCGQRQEVIHNFVKHSGQ
jgi:hypothetical protein